MAGILKRSRAEYEFTLDNMKQLIAADLGVADSDVTVEYVIGDVGPGDPMDRWPTPQGVVGVRVTVEGQPVVPKRTHNSLASQIAAVESDRRPYGDK